MPINRSMLRPDFWVDGIMYQEAVQHIGFGREALAVIPAWEEFIDVSKWRLIPSRKGSVLLGGFKLRAKGSAEVTLVRRMLDDTEAGKRALPANCPYEQVIETILTGGFTEQRYIKTSQGAPLATTMHYDSGTSTYLPKAAYRLVTELNPDTMTLLICNGFNNSWGYIDPAKGKLISAEDNLLDKYHELEASLNKH